MHGVTIEAAGAATDELRELIGELDRTLGAEYSPEQQHGLTLEGIFQPHVRFFIARLDGKAVGCGGVALFATFGEVKRMYVRPEARGRGIADAILARIESETRNAGLGVLRLETGDKQAAAMRLYDRAGFRPCAAFGDYALMPPYAIATSVFLEKALTSTL
jgi:putative acetyltransferase